MQSNIETIDKKNTTQYIVQWNEKKTHETIFYHTELERGNTKHNTCIRKPYRAAEENPCLAEASSYCPEGLP